MAAAVDMTDHSALPDTSSTTAGRDLAQEIKHAEGNESQTTDTSSSKTSSSSARTAVSLSKAKEKAKEKSTVVSVKPKEILDSKRKSGYGKNADNPLVNGTPFWLLLPPPDDDDMTDDDLPVDMDILEQVCTGKKTLDPRPFNKTTFDPFGPVSKMKAPEGDEKQTPRTPVQRKIKWSKNISVTTFDVKDRRPKEVEISSAIAAYFKLGRIECTSVT
uniref:Uncharacterized protein n=1 Tax=Parascaris equorum TaxID=6256 RepID=A0A914RLQ8_PAREQ